MALFALAAGGCTSTADGRAEASTTPAGSAAAATRAVAAADATIPNDSMLRLADNGRIMGSASAKVWLIIVSDFQCPFCREWHEVIAPTLRREYVRTGKIRVAYLNFPLSQHEHAWPAAEVAMCAGAQQKFWEVHDEIFKTQNLWNRLPPDAAAAHFVALAQANGVEAARLRACLSSEALKPLIQADADRSRTTGARSTPTIIIGNELFPGVQPIENYRRALDAALAGPASARKTPGGA